jgi:two-component system, NarL family, invasion response regulator UvrY
MTMIRVLVADDHPIVRQGVRQIVAATNNIIVAAEATNGRELLECARIVAHDLILLDLSMPGTDGLDLLKQLKRERPKIPVVILTMYSEDQFAIRALKAGAAGYLIKDCDAAELISAVRRVVAGGRHLSPNVAERLAGHLAGDTEKPLHDRLSDREYQVFRMMAAGRSTREISADLSLSVKTISTYRSRIFEKMHMKSAAELATYVVRNRLAD